MQLKAKAELTMEASYYNLLHNAWEPILEPVISIDDESNYSPWTLQAEVINGLHVWSYNALNLYYM